MRKVLSPNVPNTFVQNGDAAHSSSNRQVIVYVFEAGPEKINQPQQHGADGCTTHARCYLLMLPGGSFLPLCSLRVGCAHGCLFCWQKRDRMLPLRLVRAQRVYHKKGIPFFFSFFLYERMMLDVAETRGFALSMPKAEKCLKGLPRATHSTDRAQTSRNVTPRVDLCPPPLTFRIRVRARRDVSEKRDK